MTYWLTNNPEAAKHLRRADADYQAARAAGAYLPLAEKIVAYREAKEARDAAYLRSPYGDHLPIFPHFYDKPSEDRLEMRRLPYLAPHA